jgi:hypothetical protein
MDVLHCCGTPYTLNPKPQIPNAGMTMSQWIAALQWCTPMRLTPRGSASAGENKRGGGRERGREKEREAPALHVMHVLVAGV